MLVARTGTAITYELKSSDTVTLLSFDHVCASCVMVCEAIM